MSIRLGFIVCAAMLAPLSAHAASHCFAVCEFYSTHIDRDMSDPEQYLAFKGKVPGPGGRYPELAKYWRSLESSGADVRAAFEALQMRCMDTAAARSGEFFHDEAYAPRIIDSLHAGNADPELVCTE